MSRSYKKTPGFKDRNPYMKNYANRVVRRIPIDKEVGDYKTYIKYNCSWDICDWKDLFYNEEQVQQYFKRCESLADFYESLGSAYYIRYAARYRKKYRYEIYMK